MYSLAEAKVNSGLIPKGVYEDDKLVGFILYYFYEGQPDYVYLKRIMIDERLQEKGLGRKAMKAAIDLFKEDFPSIGCVELMHYLNNETGESLYSL